eukprot:1138864-Pelagomonas_calceolata.AAC.2
MTSCLPLQCPGLTEQRPGMSCCITRRVSQLSVLRVLGNQRSAVDLKANITHVYFPGEGLVARSRALKPFGSKAAQPSSTTHMYFEVGGWSQGAGA